MGEVYFLFVSSPVIPPPSSSYSLGGGCCFRVSLNTLVKAYIESGVLVSSLENCFLSDKCSLYGFAVVAHFVLTYSGSLRFTLPQIPLTD